MARTARTPPRAHLDRPEDDFAEGTVSGVGPDADAARAAQQLARNVRRGLDASGLSVRKAAAEAGVDWSAVYAALRGEAWLDSRTLALLERVLGPLWPGPDGAAEG